MSSHHSEPFTLLLCYYYCYYYYFKPLTLFLFLKPLALFFFLETMNSVFVFKNKYELLFRQCLTVWRSLPCGQFKPSQDKAHSIQNRAHLPTSHCRGGIPVSFNRCGQLTLFIFPNNKNNFTVSPIRRCVAVTTI